MGDSRPRINPSLLTNIAKDKEWKKLSIKDISSNPNFLIPVEEVMIDDVDENITVGCVNKKIQRDKSKKVEDDQCREERLKVLEMLAGTIQGTGNTGTRSIFGLN